MWRGVVGSWVYGFGGSRVFWGLLECFGGSAIGTLCNDCKDIHELPLKCLRSLAKCTVDLGVVLRIPNYTTPAPALETEASRTKTCTSNLQS